MNPRPDRQSDGDENWYVGPPGLDPSIVIDELDLRPLPLEGGRWSRILRDRHSSAIYYLLTGGDFSAFHRLSETETYHFYAGWPLRLSLLHPDGTASIHWVSPWLNAGHRPAFTVPGGTWQASTPGGDPERYWTLVGTTMAPAFSTRSFELGERQNLEQLYPRAVDEIRAHTRLEHPT